jgi:parallel beta-helix repeat protein
MLPHRKSSRTRRIATRTYRGRDRHHAEKWSRRRLVSCKRRLLLEALEDRRVLATWSGTLSGDTVWNSSEVQVVTGDLTVPDGVTLTIEPGTIVKLGNSGVDLFVNGTLNAEGTSAAPIVMTSFKDDIGGDTNGDGDNSQPQAGDWARLQVNGTALLEHTDIKYGGHFFGAMVQAFSSTFTLANSRLSNSALDALRVGSADPTISNNTFLNNADAAISMDLNSNPSIAGVTLSGNGINGLQVDSGSLGKDLVWDDPDIVYWLHDDVTVPMGLSLQVDAGQIVKPRYTGVELFVDGSLQVNGTSEAPVIFTAATDDTLGGDTNGDADATTPQAGSWGRISLLGNSEGNVIDYLESHYGGHFFGHSLRAEDTDLSVSHSTFTHSAADGIRLVGTDAQLTDNTFLNNADAAISMDLNSNPSIAGVTLSGNGINGLQIDSGTLGKDLVWDDSDIVYWLHDDVTVPMGLSLQVDAGQIVKPRYTGVELFVDGSLQVNGTSEAPVIFTAATDDTLGGDTNGDADATTPQAGSWGRISLLGNSEGNVIDYLESHYGGHFFGHSLRAEDTDLSCFPIVHLRTVQQMASAWSVPMPS